eukprot:5255589-Pleurochrysis_carterae.AAC.1
MLAVLIGTGRRAAVGWRAQLRRAQRVRPGAGAALRVRRAEAPEQHQDGRAARARPRIRRHEEGGGAWRPIRSLARSLSLER